MARSVPRCLAGALAVALLISSALSAQQTSSLDAMVAAERAFAARALVVGWKQAFLEFFAADAIGLSDTGPVEALADIRKAPDPPAGLRLEWEPRWGDIAASGDLGWLTGPTTTTREGAPARYGNYASIWRRRPDGRYEVLIDVGINTPASVVFPPGFSRAPTRDRYTGPADPDRALTTLQRADDDLLAVARGGAGATASAWGGRLAEGVRLHRPGQMPVTGSGAAATALAMEPRLSEGARLGAMVAASGDLGYTWGRYVRQVATPPGGAGSPGTPAPHGFYVRVWSRTNGSTTGSGVAGIWQVALDVLQPQ